MGFPRAEHDPVELWMEPTSSGHLISPHIPSFPLASCTVGAREPRRNGPPRARILPESCQSRYLGCFLIFTYQGYHQTLWPSVTVVYDKSIIKLHRYLGT